MKNINQCIETALWANGERLDKKLEKVRSLLGYDKKTEEEKYFILLKSANMADPEDFPEPITILKNAAKDAAKRYFEGKCINDEAEGKRTLLYKLEQIDRYIIWENSTFPLSYKDSEELLKILGS